MAKIFSHFASGLFTLLIVSFAMQKLLVSSSPIFQFLDLFLILVEPFMEGLHLHLCIQKLPMGFFFLTSGSFRGSDFIVRPLIHFELIFLPDSDLISCFIVINYLLKILNLYSLDSL